MGARIAFVLLLVLLCPACHGLPTLRKTPKAPQAGRFVDASEGLPTKGQWRQRLAVADLDGDGRPEIIAPPARGEPTPLLVHPHIWSRHENVWKEWETTFPDYPYSYGDVAVADFNRDGKPDLAFASHTQGVAVLLSNGDRTWRLSNDGLPKPEKFATRALAVGDLDGDGWPDLVALAEVFNTAARGPHGLRIYRNVQGKSWQEIEEIDVPGLERVFGDQVVIADAAGSGEPQIVIGSLVQNFADVVLMRDGKKWKSASSGLGTKRFVLGASACPGVKGKAPPLLFLANTSTPQGDPDALGPHAYSFDGGRWIDRSQGLPKFSARDVASGNLGGGGAGCDLAAADGDKQSIRLFRSSDGASWSDWMTIERPAAIDGVIWGLVSADVDGDGILDLVANYASGEGSGGIAVWLSRP